MTDNELDNLIMASLERQQTLKELNKVITKDIRRRAQREQLRRWAHIVLFSFGMPLLLLVFGLGIYVAYNLEPLAHLRLLLTIPIIAVTYLTWKKMKDFSIAEV